MTGTRKFLFAYRFEGAEYGFDIPAKDADEAKRRLGALGLARYDGEIFATIHVPGGNILANLIGFFKQKRR